MTLDDALLRSDAYWLGRIAQAARCLLESLDDDYFDEGLTRIDQAVAAAVTMPMRLLRDALDEEAARPLHHPGRVLATYENVRSVLAEDLTTEPEQEAIE